MEEQLVIPRPPEFIFENKSSVDAIINEGNPTYMLDLERGGIVFPETGGIEVYLQGAKYPRKGFPFPEAIHAINIAKRTLLEGIKLVTQKIMWPSVFMFTVLSSKKKAKIIEKILDSYTVIAMKSVTPYLLHDRFLTPCARETGSVTYDFLRKIGVRHDVSYKFAKVMEEIIQYDDSYRHRIQDVMSETTKEKILANPRKEIGRLFDVMIDREYLYYDYLDYLTSPNFCKECKGHFEGGKHECEGFKEGLTYREAGYYPSLNIREKLRKVKLLIQFGLLIPKVKKAFVGAIKICNLEGFQYDEADRYWVSMRNDYSFFGKTLKERGKVDSLKSVILKV